MNGSLFGYQSQGSETHPWGKSHKSWGADLCTSSFQEDTGSLWCIRREGEGENILMFPWSLGVDHSQPLVPAKLEAWPGGSSFQSMQVKLLHGKTGRWEVLPAPSVLSPVGIDVVIVVCPVGLASVFATVMWVSQS